jgi:hypothetical protein
MIGHQPVTRNIMIRALSECAESSVRGRARRFLSGLSADELDFLSEVLGACILESSDNVASAVDTVQARQCSDVRGARRTDREEKMILLREFLRHACGSGS